MQRTPPTDRVLRSCRPLRRLLREEPVLRSRQIEVLAQRLAFVLAPEPSPPLQFWHDLLAEVVEPARQVWKHHGESVACLGVEPFLHLIGDRLRRPDHRQPRIAAHALRELTYCQ